MPLGPLLAMLYSPARIMDEVSAASTAAFGLSVVVKDDPSASALEPPAAIKPPYGPNIVASTRCRLYEPSSVTTGVVLWRGHSTSLGCVGAENMRPAGENGRASLAGPEGRARPRGRPPSRVSRGSRLQAADERFASNRGGTL